MPSKHKALFIISSIILIGGGTFGCFYAAGAINFSREVTPKKSSADKILISNNTTVLPVNLTTTTGLVPMDITTTMPEANRNKSELNSSTEGETIFFPNPKSLERPGLIIETYIALIYFSGIDPNATRGLSRDSKSLGLSQELGSLEHAGENCWNPCDTRQGKCNWCGTDGWCCSLGSIGNGCDGSFGGENGHVCTLKPGKLSSFFLYLFIIFA